MPPWTKESWFNEQLTIYQPKDGYRYTIDPLILCSFVRPLLSDIPPSGQVIDIGSGCGIIPLILGYRQSGIRITGVEIQEELAAIADRNLRENRLQGRLRILCRDFNRLSIEDIGTPADLIISNPPYKKRGTGRLNPNQGRALARHEITLTIGQLFASAAPLLSPTGRLCLIYPSDRLPDLESAAQASGFFVERLCHILKTENEKAFRVVISAVKNSKASREVQPPFILYGKDGHPTKVHKALFNP